MYKLIVLATILAYAAAAPAPYGASYAPSYAPWGGFAHGYLGAPVLSAPYVKAAVPVATSYANTVRIASPTLAVAHAPVAVAHAPVVAAHAPYVAAPAYAHAW